MRNRSWKVIAALAAVIVLVLVVGSYSAEADGSKLVYVERDGYAMPSGFMTRSDVKYRHGFKKGFSAKMGPKALKELNKMKGITVSDVPIFRISGPVDQTPYGMEQIYDNPDITETSGGDGITIAHLDTGVFTDHPDLTNRIVGCLDATQYFAEECTDLDGHGTHTAGIAVADGGDGSGIYGVAPEADLFVIKVCNDFGCAVDDVGAVLRTVRAREAPGGFGPSLRPSTVASRQGNSTQSSFSGLSRFSFRPSMASPAYMPSSTRSS